MPGVYKLSMVRMVSNLTKTANVRVYKTNMQKCMWCESAVSVGK